tara:strand:- start:139 stop:1698 length:1560 start_codon:yes stop_codon:yes gene_type:complete
MFNRFNLIQLFLLVVCASVRAADFTPAWPQANGPYGNYTPRKYGVKLIDDFSKAKLVWQSETRDLGFGKGSVSGFLRHLAEREGHPGSCSGPILAEGKIFVSTFRPGGEPLALKQPQYLRYDPVQTKKPFDAEQLARLKRNLCILGDDLLVAIDKKTGKTAWIAVESRQGLNRYMGKRQGYCVGPAYFDGAVFSLGTMGMLRAYTAATGRKLWEVPVEPARAAMAVLKAKSLERQTLPSGTGWDVSLVVAEGVLVVPMFDGNDVGLRGVNVRTGKTLWEVARACSRHATPAVWRFDGSEYVLTATVSGELRLINPVNGKVQWMIDGLGENHFSLTPTDHLVMVNIGAQRPRKAGDTRRHGLLAAYRLHPDRPMLAWKHREAEKILFPTWMDSCARRFLAVADGKIYYRAHGVEKQGKKLMILAEATGGVLAELPLESPALQYYPAEDRLLAIRDASHSDTHLAMLSADPKDFRMLTKEFWNPPHLQTGAYEVYMEFPYANGFFYIRTEDGRVACYDLRR